MTSSSHTQAAVGAGVSHSDPVGYLLLVEVRRRLHCPSLNTHGVHVCGLVYTRAAAPAECRLPLVSSMCAAATTPMAWCRDATGIDQLTYASRPSNCHPDATPLGSVLVSGRFAPPRDQWRALEVRPHAHHHGSPHTHYRIHTSLPRCRWGALPRRLCLAVLAKSRKTTTLHPAQLVSVINTSCTITRKPECDILCGWSFSNRCVCVCVCVCVFTQLHRCH